jgi:hypothetical protein
VRATGTVRFSQMLNNVVARSFRSNFPIKP